MDARKEIAPLHSSLKQEHKENFSNTKRADSLLEKAKVALTGLSFLPTVESVNKDDLLIARDILEIGALFSIAVKDIPAFERYIAQLKCYYFDYQGLLPPSSLQSQLLGLNLLCLLAQNRVAEFHTELELLPPAELLNNVYIRHPVSLEQYLMEGSYNKIFQAKGNVPAASYTFFLDMLLETIRGEIAACVEKSYEKIQATEVARMLNLDSPQTLKTFAEKRGWQWSGGDYFYFKPEVKKTDDYISSMELAEQSLEYARELEMIV